MPEVVKVRPKVLADLLVHNYHSKRHPTIILGGTGVGKSDIVNQFAKRVGLPMLVKRSAYMDATDFALPALNGEGPSFTMKIPDWVFQIQRAPHVLFADEFAQGTGAVQAAWSEGFLERTFNGVKMHEGSVLVAASNRVADMAMSNLIPGQILARATVVELENHPEDWLTWARDPRNGIHNSVLAYIQFAPQALFPWHPGGTGGAAKSTEEIYRESVRSQTTTTSPRKWAFVSDALHTADNHGTDQAALECRILGEIGTAAGTAFNLYLRNRTHLTPMDRIVRDPEKAKIPEKLDVQWAQLILCAFSISEKNITPVLRYIERWAPEYRKVFVSTVEARDSTLLRCREFVEYQSRTSN